MKKIFLLLVVVGMLTTACNTGGGEDNNTPPNEQQSDGNNNGNNEDNNEDSNEDSNEDNLSSIECARNEIIYKTKYGYPVTLYKETGFGGILVSNTYENGIGRLIFDADITDIPYSSFKDCTSIIEIKFPDSVTSIGESAFEGCTSLTSITIPDSVTSIGISAFYNCTSLKSIAIPNKVTKIGQWAFSGCSSLTSVYCKPTTPPTAVLIYSSEWNAFYNKASMFKIYVPRNSVGAYKTARYWSDYADYIVGYGF